MIEIVANGLATLARVDYANAVIDTYVYGQAAIVGGLVLGIVFRGLR